MATRKQKDKNKEKLAEEVTTRETPLRQSPRKRPGSSGASPSKPIMNSLDMLAQVAAKLQDPGITEEAGQKTPPKEPEASTQKASPREKRGAAKKKTTAEENVEAEEAPEDKPTVEEKPTPKPSKMPLKKVTKRSIQSLEEVTLNQIRSLSNKAIISLFSEMTANEMSRNYTYTCYLMPDKCQESVSSFGNETKARNSMIHHLLMHINILSMKANDGDPDKEEFVAIPITVRRKKEAEAAKKKKRSLLAGSDASGKRRRTSGSKSKFTAIKMSKSEEDMEREVSDDQQAVGTTTEQPTSPAGSDSSKERDKTQDSDKQKRKTKYGADKQSLVHSALDDNSNLSQHVDLASPSGSAEESQSGSKKASKSTHSSLQAGTQGSQPDDQEQVIIDTMNRVQPFLDHSYTTIFGKRYNSDDSFLSHSSDDDEDDCDEDEDDLSDSASCSSAQSGQHKKSVPILPLSHYSGGDAEVPMVSSEEIIPRRGRPGAADADGSGHSGEKPYPPMPKSALASRGRLVVPEEENTASEAEESAAVTPKKRKKMTKGSRESHAEWEKRIALKCIRELRGRKKDDKVMLVCKICKDKSFTAGATLMYHYRSHAGIKPFVCVICNTTFTRQHSLNYHMLIHNNQSRFSCKDCGRKFRHPSHFKEHLRRHTGETPFECTECQNRFKTRNTYKRHLKTRHGKLLTVFGIHPMSKEEFLKVRTKPYKKSPGEVATTASSQSHVHTTVQPSNTTPAIPQPQIQPRPRKVRQELNAVTTQPTAAMVGSSPPASMAVPSATITSPAAHTIVTAPAAPFITYTANTSTQPATIPAHSIAMATPINAPTITMTSPAATYFLPPIAFTSAGSGIVSMQMAAPRGHDAMEEGVSGSGDDSDAMYVPIGIVEH